MYVNIEYTQVLVVQRRFCQLQINSPVMASLYIYKLKVENKSKIARKDWWQVRHFNPQCIYRKLCQSPKPKFCF